MNHNQLQHRFLTALSFYTGCKNRALGEECLNFATRDVNQAAQLFLNATEAMPQYEQVRRKAKKVISELEYQNLTLK
jgi:hypothetical protein